MLSIRGEGATGTLKCKNAEISKEEVFSFCLKSFRDAGVWIYRVEACCCCCDDVECSVCRVSSGTDRTMR